MAASRQKPQTWCSLTLWICKNINPVLVFFPSGQFQSQLGAKIWSRIPPVLVVNWLAWCGCVSSWEQAPGSFALPFTKFDTVHPLGGTTTQSPPFRAPISLFPPLKLKDIDDAAARDLWRVSTVLKFPNLYSCS